MVLLGAYKAGLRERAFWYAKAAEYGDAEAIAAVLNGDWAPNIKKKHLHHLMAIAKYSGGSAEGFSRPRSHRSVSGDLPDSRD